MLLHGLAFTRHVGPTSKQVVGQQQFNALDTGTTGIAKRGLVVVPVMVGTQIQTRQIGRFARFDCSLVSARIFKRRIQGRAVGEPIAHQDIGRRRHGADRELVGQRGQRGWRLFANDAEIACAHIMEVSQFGQQIGLGQSETATGLFDVNATTHPCFGTLFHQATSLLVFNIVLLGGLDQFAVARHIGIGLHGLQRGRLGSFGQLVVTRQLGIAKPFDLIGREQAVKQHLVQRELRPIEAVSAKGPRRSIPVFPARAGAQIHLREIATTRHIAFVGCRQEAMPAGLYLGIAGNGLARRLDHRLGQRLSLNPHARQHGNRNYG